MIPGKDEVLVSYTHVTFTPNGLAVFLEAAEGESFPEAATFVGVKPFSSTAAIRDIVSAGSMQYDECTLGVGKRAYVDAPELFTAVPAALVGSNFIMTADSDKKLVHQPPTDRKPEAVDCAVMFKTTTPATVYVAHKSTGVAEPQWIQSGFRAWIDPATKLQGVLSVGEGGAAFDLPIFHSKRKMDEVCLTPVHAFVNLPTTFHRRTQASTPHEAAQAPF